MKEIQLPEEKIQQLAEKYAMEGAEKAIREYYTGYNSPYVKAMTEHLTKIAPSPRFDLPDLTAAINKALSDRIMDMANEVVAKTYVKLFNRIFTPNEYNQATVTMLFQQFGDYIKDREGDDFDSEDLEFETGKDYFGTELRYLKFKYQSEVEFDLTIWGRGQTENGEKLYEIAKLPGSGTWNKNESRKQYAKITLDDGKQAEVPILDDILSNDFLAYLAKIMLCKTQIVVDTTYPEWHDYGD